MRSLWEAIRALFEKLFGGSETLRRLKALDAMEENFAKAKRDNSDSLETLKEEIRTLEARALHKKKELDQTHGDSNRIVVGEIERIFRELDRLRGRETVISANLDRVGIALAKIGEAKAALRAGVTDEQFDDIALEVQELFGQLRESDRAARDLEKEQYEVRDASRVEVEQRMAEVQGVEPAPVALTAETQKRLKQLETEEA